MKFLRWAIGPSDLVSNFRNLALGLDSYSMRMFGFFLGACFSLAITTIPHAFELALVFILGLVFYFFGAVTRFLACLIFGFVWICINAHNALQISFPSAYERVDFAASGVVEGLPVSHSGNSQFPFKIIDVENEELSSLVGKRVKLSCYRCPYKIAGGEQWRFTLRLKKPHGYASWGAFDYEKFLFRNKMIAKGYVRLNKGNQRLSVGSSLLPSWRYAMFKKLKTVLNDDVGSQIVLALSMGVKSGFTQQQRAVFQLAGVSHLLAISGLHVGLVFGLVNLVLRYVMWPIARIYEYCPRQRLTLIPSLCAAFIYSASAGFSISTKRALTMLVVFVLCKFLARKASLHQVLLLTICLILVFDPFSILDVGFWLSGGAVASIALALHAGRLGSYSSDPRPTLTNNTLSLARLQLLLWIAMLPLGVIFFGQISLVSPIVNLVAVPLFSLLLIPATLLSVLLFYLGLTSLATWCLLKLKFVFETFYQLLNLVLEFELARIFVTPWGWWQWIVYACLIASFIVPLRGKSLWAGLLLLSLFVNTSQSLHHDELRVALLDVGQGLTIVVETPNSVTVYDTGPRYGSGFTSAQAVLLPYLRQRGVKKINTLIVSHADNDHIGGLDTLRDAFPIEHLLSSRTDKVADADECLVGQTWRYNQTSFTVLSPDADTPRGSNNRSCVILIEHHETRILLTGDIEKPVERYLVNTMPDKLVADILLVPHQGSKTSSTDHFIDAVSPSMAMVAAGYLNHYGHPHRDVVRRYHSRGIELLSTITHGSILLKINSKGWKKERYRQRYKRFWRRQKLPNSGA